MSRRPYKLHPPRRGRALTLVEVVAALALLGSVVTVLLLAQSRSLHQLATARERLEAGKLAEQLVTGWRLTDEQLAVPAEGVFAGAPGWWWNRSITTEQDESNLGFVRIALTLVHRDDRGTGKMVATYEWLEPASRKP